MASPEKVRLVVARDHYRYPRPAHVLFLSGLATGILLYHFNTLALDVILKYRQSPL